MLRSHGLRWLFTLSFPLLAAHGAFAQMKVGVINTQTALSDTAEIKKAQADLEAKYKPAQAEIAKLQKQLETINQQLSMGDKLTPQAQADLTLEGQRTQRDLQRRTEDLQEEADRERTDVITKSSERMRAIVAKLAEQKGLDLVIDTTNTVYYKPALDITKEATVAYDAAYPVK